MWGGGAGARVLFECTTASLYKTSIRYYICSAALQAVCSDNATCSKMAAHLHLSYIYSVKTSLQTQRVAFNCIWVVFLKSDDTI